MQSVQIQNISSVEFEQIIFRIVTEALKNSSIGVPTSPSASASDRLLTKKEAANYLKVSLPTLSRYIKDGYVKAYTISGTRMRFRVSDLDKALKTLRGC